MAAWQVEPGGLPDVFCDHCVRWLRVPGDGGKLGLKASCILLPKLGVLVEEGISFQSQTKPPYQPALVQLPDLISITKWNTPDLQS